MMETFNPRQRIKGSWRNFQGNYADRVEHDGVGSRGPRIDCPKTIWQIREDSVANTREKHEGQGYDFSGIILGVSFAEK